MEKYSDTLRGRIVPGEPPELTNDPELHAAREKLLTRMYGTAWADSSPMQRIGFVLHCIFAWGCVAAIAGFGVGVVLFFIVALTTGDHSMTKAECEFVIRGGFYLGPAHFRDWRFLATALRWVRLGKPSHGLDDGAICAVDGEGV